MDMNVAELVIAPARNVPLMVSQAWHQFRAHICVSAIISIRRAAAHRCRNAEIYRGISLARSDRGIEYTNRNWIAMVNSFQMR